MAYEEIEVRITREGHIFVDTRGMEPERVRSVMDYLRETVGPTARIVTDPDDMPAQRINLEATQRSADEQREAERERTRLGPA